jgi:hypothetical protein
VLPDIDLQKRLDPGKPLQVCFSVELHFAPRTGWPPLEGVIKFPLVPGPPRRWQIALGAAELAGSASAEGPPLPSSSSASSSSSSKDKAVVRCGEPWASALPHVFLVDEHKNRVLHGAWAAALGAALGSSAAAAAPPGSGAGRGAGGGGAGSGGGGGPLVTVDVPGLAEPLVVRTTFRSSAARCCRRLLL